MRLRSAMMLATVLTLISACAANPAVPNDTLVPVAQPNTELYTLGQQVYAQNCASCHGANGEGQFPQAPMQPDSTGRYGAPPHNGIGHTWHHDDELLVRIVTQGGMGNPEQFYPMPAFGDVLTEDEIIAVLAYIKTLWSQEQQALQRERTLAVSGG